MGIWCVVLWLSVTTFLWVYGTFWMFFLKENHCIYCLFCCSFFPIRNYDHLSLSLSLLCSTIVIFTKERMTPDCYWIECLTHNRNQYIYIVEKMHFIPFHRRFWKGDHWRMNTGAFILYTTLILLKQWFTYLENSSLSLFNLCLMIFLPNLSLTVI